MGKITYIFFLTLLAVALSGCGKHEANANKVRIAYLPITHALVLYETQKSKDLNVELVKYGSWPELLDALNTGRVDAASVLIEPAMKAREQGIDLTVLALGHRDGNVIVGAKGIRTAGELREKNFAVPHRASSHYLLFRKYLEKNGVSADSVRVTELAPAEMPSALASGRIAGYCVAEPFGAVAVENGSGVVLASSSELWPDSICCALTVNRRFLKEKPELAAKFLSEYNLAGERLANPSTALANAAAFLKCSSSVLNRSLRWIHFDKLELSPQAYLELTKMMKQYGISRNPPSYQEFAGETP